MNDEPDTPKPLPPVPATPADIPLFQTAHSMQRCLKPVLGDGLPDFGALIDEIGGALMMDHGGNDLESLLAGQARVLDSAFHASIAAATARGYLDEGKMSLAMKAQRQCRNTVETLRGLQQGFPAGGLRRLKKLANEMKDLEKTR